MLHKALLENFLKEAILNGASQISWCFIKYPEKNLPGKQSGEVLKSSLVPHEALIKGLLKDAL